MKWLAVCFVGLLCVIFVPHDTSALGLKIAPLKYETQLTQGQKKKGFVDISNPESSTVKVTLSVQAFRQINDDGGLEFYDNETVNAGIRLDYKTFDLGPRQAMRMYFLIDGTKLAQGDVFAGIFASTTPVNSPGTSQSVRVGTLLLIQNGTPPSRNALISDFKASWFQISDGYTAQFKIKNTDDVKRATGFRPNVELGYAPYGSKTIQGPLVFAGRTRMVEVSEKGSYFGPMRLSAKFGDSQKDAVVFVITGYWRWLAPAIIVLISITLFVTFRYKTERT